LKSISCWCAHSNDLSRRARNREESRATDQARSRCSLAARAPSRERFQENISRQVERESMKSLVIRFIDEPGIVARLISGWTDSLFCHTEGLSRDGKSWVGAHAGTGVEGRPLDWSKPTFERVYSIPVTDEQYELAMRFMESK